MKVKLLRVGPIGTNCYILEDDQTNLAAVIDPGDEPELIQEALEKEGVTILEPEDPQAWSQAMEPVYRKYGGEYLDLIEKIRQIR